MGRLKITVVVFYSDNQPTNVYKENSKYSFKTSQVDNERKRQYKHMTQKLKNCVLLSNLTAGAD